jgi:hypothetical protein
LKTYDIFLSRLDMKEPKDAGFEAL